MPTSAAMSAMSPISMTVSSEPGRIATGDVLLVREGGDCARGLMYPFSVPMFARLCMYWSDAGL